MYNMSEGLEKLKSLGEHHCSLMQKYESGECEIPCRDCKYLQEESIVEKELKAFEIVKEKKVNVPSLITLFKSQTSYEDYEQLWDNDIRWQLTKNWDIQFSRHKLTQEEFDLLKDILL